MNRRLALQMAAASSWPASLVAHGADRPKPERLLARDLSLADKPGAPDLARLDGSCVPLAASGQVSQVKAWLLDCSATDMTGCTLDPPQRDAYLGEPPWLSRAVAAYAFIRGDFSAGERRVVDDWFRRNAEFNQTQIDGHMTDIFPRRVAGDYSVRGRDAKSGQMLQRRLTQGGPQISVLSQWYNNRRSAVLLFVMQAGMLLQEPSFIESAARYVREWVAYAVWPGGAQGEWLRNGNYGYVSAGLAYGASNIALALLTAMWMAERGDDSLLRFSTSNGLFGSESPGKPKTIWTAFDTHVALLDGSLSLRDEQGRLFDPLLTPFGRPMHASWYLPAARRYGRSVSLDRWAAASAEPDQKLDDPFGLWRGMSGIFVDVRKA